MFQQKGNQRPKAEPPRRLVPTAGDLVAGRDFDWNDRVGMIRALSTGKNIFIPNIGKPFVCDGPVYGFHDSQYLYGVDTGPVPNTQMAAQASGNTPTTRPMLKANFQGGPLVLLAAARSLGTPAADTWVNLAGVLDRSCRPEKHYGIRTFGGLQRAIFYSDGFQTGGAAGLGDFWEGSTYTISVAILPFNGGSPSNPWVKGAEIIGFGNFSGGHDAFPWFLRVMNHPQGSPDLFFQFRYRDADNVGHTLLWPFPKTNRVIRLYIMVDIDRVRFDRNVVVYMDSGSGPKKPNFREADPGTPHVPFSRGFFTPFSIGYFACVYNLLVDPHRANDDFVLCGLHIENRLTYKDDGAGGIVRADTGGAINDEYAFFTPRESTAGLLPLVAKGGALPNEIATSFQGGGGVGFLLHNIDSSAYLGGAGIYNLSLYGQQLHGVGHYYGDALAVAQILGCYVRGCSLSGGTSAIRMWNTGGNEYYMRFSDLQLQAGAAVVCGQNADVAFDEVEMIIGARGYGFYMSGSGLRINKLRISNCYGYVRNHIFLDMIPGSNNPNSLLVYDYNDDNEGQSWPTDANIRVHDASRVEIHGAFLGTLPLPGPTNPAGSPFLALGPIGANIPGASKGHVELGNINPYVRPITGASLIRVEDPNWNIRVLNSSAFNGIYGYLDDTTGGRCSARIEHLDLGAIPPRWGACWAGKHEVFSPPSPGQFAEWRCLVSGTHGTVNPPVWTGLYPNVVPGSNQAAAYAMNYIGVAGTPFTIGVLIDSLVDSLIRRLFGKAPSNPLVTPAAPLHAGLIALYHVARGDRRFTETSSPSIQQIRIRNNPAITGGTFKLSFKGKSTAPIAANSPPGGIAQALAALPTIGEGAVHVENNNYQFNSSNEVLITFKGAMGDDDQPLVKIEPEGLKGTGFSFEIVPLAHGGGYGRAPVSFKPATRGASSNTAEIRFPKSTGPWNQSMPIHFWMLATGARPQTGSMFLAGKLAEPVTIKSGDQPGPRFPSGSLAVVHRASVQGGFTYHAADLILNAILLGTTIEPPTTWHIGLSLTPVDASGAGLHEPSGNGYARIAVPNNPDHWTYNPFRFVAGAACNKSPLRFADPAGAWAEGRPLPYWFLADSPRGGTIWASGTFPVPVVVADRSAPPPSFAPQTFLIILI